MKSNIPVFKGKNPILRGAEFLKNPFLFTTGPGRAIGDFYRIPFIFRKVFVATNHEVVRHVLQTNQKNYVKSVAYRHLKLALGNGLVTSEGEYWRRQRRLAQPVFYKTQLEGIFRAMAEVGERCVAALVKKAAPGQPLDMAKEMMGITSDIVLKTLFSAESPADLSEMYRIMIDAQDYIVFRTTRPHLIPFVYINGMHRRFKKDMDWFDGYLYRLMDERRKDPNPPNDLLTMLLSARYEDTGEAMDDRQVRDEAITLFAAGHETSSNGLAWTLYLLSKHPAILEKLRTEVEDVLGSQTPSFENLRHLTYTLQVIQEGMRLYPPAFAIGREPVEDDKIMGETIPAGSVIFISIAAIHRDPRYWERPDTFYPDHFLPEIEKERPRLAYMPFGAGPRMCIGNHFALMEMQLLLAMLVRQFDFDLLEDHPVEPEPLITLKPRHGILMKLRGRKVAVV
ncbi:MAG: cytochrome P450 [Lewinellaceae bacterium]|nr:cytochrome P450 [Saprospiraceae bacterium]MCB9338565.1 cytochrome P450 [Lewinellaceae bacterium]